MYTYVHNCSENFRGQGTIIAQFLSLEKILIKSYMIEDLEVCTSVGEHIKFRNGGFETMCKKILALKKST